MEAINDKNILIIDDSITNGQTLREAYKIIAEGYEPKSITILTLMSPLYNKRRVKVNATLKKITNAKRDIRPDIGVCECFQREF